MFNHFIQALQTQLNKPLPGQDAQYQMVNSHRLRVAPHEMKNLNARQAAVLILFYAIENQPYLVFMQRNQYPGVHSNQISFPGGKYEEQDKDLVTTALRESQEELNIIKEQVQVHGCLTPVYIPPSNFLVEPVIGSCTERPHFVPDTNEVADIIELPFSFFLCPESIQTVTVPSGNEQYTVPAYVKNTTIIWGATAMMMSELTCLMKNSYQMLCEK